MAVGASKRSLEAGAEAGSAPRMHKAVQAFGMARTCTRPSAVLSRNAAAKLPQTR